MKPAAFFGCTDSELIEAIRQDNQKAFEELFERYWKKIYDFAYVMAGSVEVSQEVVQELFISIWENRELLSIDHLPSYLYAEVKTRVLNHIESQIDKL